MRETLEQLWDNLSDPYWRIDHPEVTAVLLGVISGMLGLLFAWLKTRLIDGKGEGER